MADEEKNEGQNPEESEGSGLGNLPPLSDFDSGGTTSDGGLPPLGDFESDKGDSGSVGGLPPLEDINVETPAPAGGNIKPAPPGFETPSDSFSSGDSPIESPNGTGFQDLAADSDFSPETPEIGPGPDSDMDTPMFDSAFGAGFDASSDTPAPTQAMETPMFGGAAAPEEGGGGFEAGAFGDFGADVGGGATPTPDFTPDTGMQQPMSVQTGGGGGGGGIGMGGLIATAVVCIIIGLVGGPFAANSIPGWPAAINPLQTKIDEVTEQNEKLNVRIRQYENAAPEGAVDITPAARQALADEIADLTAQKGDIAKETEAATGKLQEVTADLNETQRTLDDTTAKFEKTQGDFDELTTELSITQARQNGLKEEVDFLVGTVGELREANTRRAATKEALQHNIDRLYIQVKESLPLTPAKFDYAKRVGAVEALRDLVNRAKWVTPELQDTYTSLYLSELQLAQAQEFFFARLQVTDRFGNKTQKWAECLQKGANQVLYRSLDGKNIGIFENLSSSDDPVWGVNEGYGPDMVKNIEAEVFSARPDGFETKLQAVAQIEVATLDSTSFQRAFDSL